MNSDIRRLTRAIESLTEALANANTSPWARSDALSAHRAGNALDSNPERLNRKTATGVLGLDPRTFDG